MPKNQLNSDSIQVSVFWFRRDLRLDDNAGLSHALSSGYPVVPVFIFDSDILNDLENKADRRVCFIHDTILEIQKRFISLGTTFHVLVGTPLEAFRDLSSQYVITAVYTNVDYEPYARSRDLEVESYCRDQGIAFYTLKDQVIFEKNEVVKEHGEPYTIFTPYKIRWQLNLADEGLSYYPSSHLLSGFYKQPPRSVPTLNAIGFRKIEYEVSPLFLNEPVARFYENTRDFPGIAGTTHLSVHLRFGTLGIRSLTKTVKAINETLLGELIWREFYQMLLWHFPGTVAASFKPAYDNIVWRNNEKEFEAWRNGVTGYPLVDAGMRELNSTGWMHNRVRMVTASFLCKHLLIDWRWGEAYFAQKLMDYDLAANVGNWQWVAGSGASAAPYFRIFNPMLQTGKFDPQGKYIRKWIPELGTASYPQPIIDHVMARSRCLTVYKQALAK